MTDSEDVEVQRKLLESVVEYRCYGAGAISLLPIGRHEQLCEDAKRKLALFNREHKDD